jgi:alkylhydroperoxidase family enzyme
MVTGGTTMQRVREIEDDGGDPLLAEAFAQDRARFGDLLNTTRIMAHCPPILAAARALGAAIERSGQLPPGLLPLVYLRVATINGCPF